MVKLKHLLREAIDDAAEQAHKRGLTSVGWGYWADDSGDTVAKTIDDKLVKLSDAEKNTSTHDDKKTKPNHSDSGIQITSNGFNALEASDAIGWDFDGTLFGHENSRKMHEFIRKNPNKKHYLITFRTGPLVRDMFPHLAEKYGNTLSSDNFAGIVSIPPRLWSARQPYKKARKLGILDGPLTPIENAYASWKGEQCKQLGLTHLVDDVAADVLPGCKSNNIGYIHPDHL